MLFSHELLNTNGELTYEYVEKTPRANSTCDYCKKRHLKCGRQLPTCDTCISRHSICVYSHPQKRGPKPKDKYVTDLESRVKEMNELVKKQKKQLSQLQKRQVLESKTSTAKLMQVSIPVTAGTEILSEVFQIKKKCICPSFAFNTI